MPETLSRARLIASGNIERAYVIGIVTGKAAAVLT